MAGHSKWHQIKRKKGVTDAKRGQAFTQLGKKITVAARLGGGDVEMNPSLKLAVEKAKAANMPNANIDRAIKAGTGELKDAAEIHELLYEAYGPGGVALYIRTLTDNKNRTVAHIREVCNKNGGSLGASGSVAYLFQRKASIQIQIPETRVIEDMELWALEGGAEDIQVQEAGECLLLCAPEEAAAVQAYARDQGVLVTDTTIIFVPTTTVVVSDKEQAIQLLKILDLLEENEDVEEVFVNFVLDEPLSAIL